MSSIDKGTTILTYKICNSFISEAIFLGLQTDVSSMWGIKAYRAVMMGSSPMKSPDMAKEDERQLTSEYLPERVTKYVSQNFSRKENNRNHFAKDYFVIFIFPFANEFYLL